MDDIVAVERVFLRSGWRDVVLLGFAMPPLAQLVILLLQPFDLVDFAELLLLHDLQLV